MCGRITETKPQSHVEATFAIQQVLFDDEFKFSPRYNAGPMTRIALITLRDGKRTLEPMTWGYTHHKYKIPAKGELDKEGKQKKKPAQPINARYEGVGENFIFRFSLQDRRCIVPVDGWYEWPVIDGEKQPYRIHFTDDRLFGLPAIWDSWQKPDGSTLLSFAIITGQSGNVSAEVHDRQPMFFAPDTLDAWLDCAGVSAKDALGLLIPEVAGLEAYPVSKAVGSVKNQGEELIKMVDGKVFG